MNDSARKKVTAPPTPEQLDAELAALERQLHEARRGQNAAKSELPRHIVAGDAQAVAQCREDLAFCEARIRELTAAIETAREAARLASGQERRKLNSAIYNTLRRGTNEVVAAAEQQEGTIEALASSNFTIEEGLAATYATMRQADIQADPDARAKFRVTTDRALYFASRGTFGRLLSLESPDELRRSGAASLTYVAREWQAVALRDARRALQIPEET
jgi:hypothetical protein